ncbi:MAG: hypothetical protein WAO35_29120 [Terriglobia bacterium]
MNQFALHPAVPPASRHGEMAVPRGVAGASRIGVNLKAKQLAETLNPAGILREGLECV